MAAYACDNADPDSDPELVAKFLAHLRQVEADTEKKYADMALHYERMRARLEGKQSVHIPTEAEYRAFLAASPSVDPAINGYRWLCENIKPKPQAERGIHIPPEAMQGWSQEEMAKHRNMAMGQQSKPEPCVSLPNDDKMYRQARIYSSYDPEKDDKESFYYKIQCAFIDGFHRCRANVKMRTVDDVRLAERAKCAIEAQVLVDALEEIANSTKFSQDTALKRSFSMLQHIAREALEKWRGNEN